MAMPEDPAAIDLMLTIPDENFAKHYEFMKPMLKDEESLKNFKMPAEYMFKDIPQAGKQDDYIAYTLDKMDEVGVAKAMIGMAKDSELSIRALKEHPDRFIGYFEVDPTRGMKAVRDIRYMKEHHDIKCVTAFPAGCRPQVPINDKMFYPIYAACVDLDLPIGVCCGVPGPRVPMACQDVALIDEVCWYFPELKFIMKHGAEPWTDLAVKLMLKWPNLYYMTSAFAPKHYPKDIIHYANTRGADKIMYAGYFPMGLSLRRIFDEMPGVPFRDHVWPKFLRENAIRVLGLEP
jgi:predicted TIM-barrel fold metal-dependent hydrolase